MPSSALLLEKDTNLLSKQILDLFESVRAAYLMARTDSKSYGNKWQGAVKQIREKLETKGSMGTLLSEYVNEKDLTSQDVMNPESTVARNLYESIKELRLKDDAVKDPFAKEFGDETLDRLLEDQGNMVKFIHYAIRSDNRTLMPECYAHIEVEEDKITRGLQGLDLHPDDVSLYISEHYGDEKDTSTVETKVKAAFDSLKEAFLHMNSEEDWSNLMRVDVKKSTEEKAISDFVVPNKPMYRIFDIEDMNELKGFSGEYVVQEKYDGMRIQIHKIDDRVKIYSYNEKDITEKCPEQVKVMQAKHFGDCILDGELILFDGDSALHRADTIAHVFKDKYKDARLRAHVFDIIRHEDRSIHDETLQDRLNTLFNNYSIHSDEYLQFPSKKDTRMADSLKDIEKYAEEIMDMPTAEGVVIKDATSTYFIGTKKNPKWVKWKKFKDLDLLVLGKKKTKSNLYSYTLGAGPVTEGEGKIYSEYEGKKYMNVGKALNTKINVDVGAILRVKVDEVKSNGEGFTIYSAKVIEIPEVQHPDKVITLELLAEDTKPSLKYKVKALRKGFGITDYIHGEATIIMKSDLDGFTIYGFEEDNLMSKNAIANLDYWKTQAEEVMKTKQALITTAVLNFLKDKGPQTIDATHKFLLEKVGEEYEDVLESDKKKLKNWLDFRDGITFDRQTNKLIHDVDKLIKYETPDKYRKGQFKIYYRKDENLELVMKLGDEELSWTIDIETEEDIYSLFGKAGKYPAEVTRASSKRKVLDSGDITLGVQREDYHEYFLSGNRFETKMHFRVIEVDGKEMWLAWTGYKQTPADKSNDEGQWNFTQGKYKKLALPTEETEAIK